MSLLISIVLVIALALLFGWLTMRARRALVKWPGVIVSGLLAALCTLVGVVALLGVYKLEVPRANPLVDIKVASSTAQIARGERLAYLCANCHSSNGQLPLGGGTENFVEALGTLVAPNLTPGGPLKDWSDSEIVRAIRAGSAVPHRRSVSPAIAGPATAPRPKKAFSRFNAAALRVAKTSAINTLVLTSMAP
jgi:hypothetical protein